MKSISSGYSGYFRGTEGNVCVGLITQRSQVQILPRKPKPLLVSIFSEDCLLSSYFKKGLLSGVYRRFRSASISLNGAELMFNIGQRTTNLWEMRPR
jgi:hypothetical protein